MAELGDGRAAKASGKPDILREKIRRRREILQKTMWEEVERLRLAAAEIRGVKRIILFGSLTAGDPGIASDVDLLLVWETALPFLERTVELYRRLQPRVSADILAYTPEEMERMKGNPLVRRALQEGKVLYEA